MIGALKKNKKKYMHVRFVLLAHGDILHFEKLSYFKDSQLQKSSLFCL